MGMTVDGYTGELSSAGAVVMLGCSYHTVAMLGLEDDSYSNEN